MLKEALLDETFAPRGLFEQDLLKDCSLNTSKAAETGLTGFGHSFFLSFGLESSSIDAS